MACINLKKPQAAKIARMLAECPDNCEVWIHGEIESVFVQIEDANCKTVCQFRVYENGIVNAVPWEA